MIEARGTTGQLINAIAYESLDRKMEIGNNGMTCNEYVLIGISSIQLNNTESLFKYGTLFCKN